MVDSETGGTRAVGGHPPRSARQRRRLADPGSELYGVTCTSAGNCTAVGTYKDSGNNYQGMTDSETGGSWAATCNRTDPAGNRVVNARPQELFGVSCHKRG